MSLNQGFATAAPHHEIREVAAAVRAAEPRVDQRHVTVIDQGLQVGITPTAAGLAPNQHADITGA
jgi:hypothetical protein